jgi:hypothetical protein
MTYNITFTVEDKTATAPSFADIKITDPETGVKIALRVDNLDKVGQSADKVMDLVKSIRSSFTGK